MNQPKTQVRHRDIFPWLFIVGAIALVVIIMFLFVSIVQGEQQTADQKTKAADARANVLQQSVDALRRHLDEALKAANQDRGFFELVRQLLIAQDAAQRKALLDSLKNFKFSTQPSTSTTHTTSKPRATPTTRAPPSSTTTTSTTRPTSPPPTTCVIVPVLNRQVCH